MKITALVENTTSDIEFLSEHGLSLYIETNNHKILFDTGQSSLFYENAVKLNIDLSKVDICVLSHGHYDHGGGLSAFLNVNKKATVYVNENSFLDYYNGDKYIGLEKSLEDNPKIVKISDEFIIDSELSLFSCNNKEKIYELGSFGLSKMSVNNKVDDDFLHEHYLLINEGENKVLISGCSHKGILNIANWFDAKTIVGGFHFSKLNCDEMLKSYAKILSDTGITFYTCHCTGVKQYEYMKAYMENLHYISTADTIEIS